MAIPPYPGYGSQHGYSAQTWLARMVNEILHPGTYYCWYTARFNAYQNGDDSNPLWLYLTIDRATNQGGVNNAKIKDIRANLLAVADSELRKAGKSDAEIADVLDTINSAPLDAFTPQLWKIDRSAVAGRAKSGQYPEEYLVKDLKSTEFTIIVD